MAGVGVIQIELHVGTTLLRKCDEIGIAVRCSEPEVVCRIVTRVDGVEHRDTVSGKRICT